MASRHRFLAAIVPITYLALSSPTAAQDCRAAIQQLTANLEAGGQQTSDQQAGNLEAGGQQTGDQEDGPSAGRGPARQSGTAAVEHPQWGDPTQDERAAAGDRAAADEATGPGAVTEGDVAETHPQAGAPLKDSNIGAPTLRSGDVAETQAQQGDPTRAGPAPEDRQRLLALRDRAETLEAQGREQECLDVIEQIKTLRDAEAAQ